MTKCGWASIDERGKASGGKAGDQTGREVKTGDWYYFNQKYVIRYKDAKMARRHATVLKKLCNGNLVGYDQNQRISLYSELKKVGFTVSKLKSKCEADCSSLQNACAIAAGAKGISPSLATGTMLNGLDGKSGYKGSDDFIILTDKKYLTSGDYLLQGDIIVAPGHHTIGVLENGKYAGNEEREITKKKASSSSKDETKKSSQPKYYTKYKGSSKSIVDALKEVGIKDKRKDIAKANGISDYKGTTEQNAKLLSLLKSGKLKKA